MTSYKIPTKVYKYFNKKREFAIIAFGLFYINTFSKIRARDNGLINDNTEGSVNNNSGDLEIEDSTDPKYKTVIDYLEDSKFIVIEKDARAKIKMSNSNIIQNLDAYMYCVTAERNDSYWKNIPEDQGGPYDRCIEIINFVEFSRQLFYQLKMQKETLKDLGIGKTFFESNQGKLANDTIKRLNPFRKPTDYGFKQQKEWRIVMSSSDQDYSPQTVYIPLEYFKFIDT